MPRDEGAARRMETTRGLHAATAAAAAASGEPREFH